MSNRRGIMYALLLLMSVSLFIAGAILDKPSVKADDDIVKAECVLSVSGMGTGRVYCLPQPKAKEKK